MRGETYVEVIETCAEHLNQDLVLRWLGLWCIVAEGNLRGMGVLLDHECAHSCTSLP